MYDGSADERLLPQTPLKEKACLPLPELPYPVSLKPCGPIDQRAELFLRLALEFLKKLSKSPPLIGGLSGHLIEPTTSSRIAGHRFGFY